MFRSLIAILAAAVLAGCAAGTDYRRPAEELPAQWPVGLQQAQDAREAWARWWTRYQDPVLDELVQQALDSNLDVGIAAARVVEARAMLGLAEAERYPTLDVLADVTRGAPGAAAPSGNGVVSNFGVTGVLAYEVDLWGRLASATDAARADLLQVSYVAEAVRLGLVADVVSTYFDLRALQQQVATTEFTIDTRRQALTLEQSRFRNGAATQLSLRRAEAELASAEAQMPTLRAMAMQRARALAVLTGLDAAQVMEPAALPAVDIIRIAFSPTVAERLPSELLERRPDIRAAEAGLMATDARIGEARAAWFPRVDLAATFGSGALGVGSLFSGPAALWQVGAAVLAPMLDFGRRRAEVDSAEARRDVAELQYRATVREAFREVGDAWSLVEAASHRLEALNRQVDALEDSVSLADRRYANGYSPYLELLDARRALYDAQLAQSDALRDRLSATAMLFKAMGGGWEG